MIKNKIPCFKRGEILDSELLKNLRDAPYEFFSLKYSKNPDGVIFGLEVLADIHTVIISCGIVRYKNFYYRINENVVKKVPMEDGDYIIKMKFYEINIESRSKYHEYSVEIKVETEEITENEIELARIKRREGAEIRNIEEFYGIEKEYNIISEIQKPQSTTSGIILSNNIMKTFAKKILEKKETEAIDDCICVNILSGNISREAINLYILKKLDIDSSESKNSELYGYLSKIYLNLKDSKKSKNIRTFVKNKMIVE